jgi:hypothetical protein
MGPPVNPPVNPPVKAMAAAPQQQVMESQLLTDLQKTCRLHIEKHLENKLVYGLIIADAECQRMIDEYARDVMLAYKEIIMNNESRRCIDLDTFVTIRFHDKLFLHKLLSIIKPKMNEELNNALKMFKTL